MHSCKDVLIYGHHLNVECVEVRAYICMTISEYFLDILSVRYTTLVEILSMVNTLFTRDLWTINLTRP